MGLDSAEVSKLLKSKKKLNASSASPVPKLLLSAPSNTTVSPGLALAVSVLRLKEMESANEGLDMPKMIAPARKQGRGRKEGSLIKSLPRTSYESDSMPDAKCGNP